jgi:hypothetical protein
MTLDFTLSSLSWINSTGVLRRPGQTGAWAQHGDIQRFRWKETAWAARHDINRVPRSEL